MPDELAKQLKEAARSERKSVSSLMAEAVEFYLREERRRRAAEEILELAGKMKIPPDVYDELEKMRKEDEGKV